VGAYFSNGKKKSYGMQYNLFIRFNNILEITFLNQKYWLPYIKKLQIYLSIFYTLPTKIYIYIYISYKFKSKVSFISLVCWLYFLLIINLLILTTVNGKELKFPYHWELSLKPTHYNNIERFLHSISIIF